MGYLYGDSTPSTLEINYIEFLRDAVDYCVQVLLADQRMAEARARTRVLDQSTGAEIERLEQLGATVEKAIAGVSAGAPESATGRCAAAIARAAGDLVRAEVGAVQSALGAEQGKRDAQASREREACVKELERLLVKHDLPDMTVDTQITLAVGGRYHCRARLITAFGLATVLELDIPSGHLYAQLVRVDRLFERLDIQTPELSGWLHKEVKLKPQHLDKHHLVALSLAAGQSVIKLRAAPDGTGGGFDVVVSREAPRVRLFRVDEQGGQSGPPFETQDADAAKLLALHEKVAAAATELGRHRRAIVEAMLDGESLRVADKSTVVVERLIATMAPVVQEIAARSLSPGELVLRRLLADDRREEVFLSKDELRRKLEPLGAAKRALFDRLLLDGAASREPAVPSVPATDKPQAPLRSGRGTPLAGVVVGGAVQLAPALPSPVGSGPPVPADPARGSLRAKLGVPVLGVHRPTPTNPGPAIAPDVPIQIEPPPPAESGRPRTGTPLSGVPVEAPMTPTAPVAAPPDAMEAKEIEPTS